LFNLGAVAAIPRIDHLDEPAASIPDHVPVLPAHEKNTLPDGSVFSVSTEISALATTQPHDGGGNEVLFWNGSTSEFGELPLWVFSAIEPSSSTLGWT
jgi:hypothetical protein